MMWVVLMTDVTIQKTVDQALTSIFSTQESTMIMKISGSTDV